MGASCIAGIWAPAVAKPSPLGTCCKVGMEAPFVTRCILGIDAASWAMALVIFSDMLAPFARLTTTKTIVVMIANINEKAEP